jgi:hypothetical protein
MRAGAAAAKPAHFKAHVGAKMSLVRFSKRQIEPMDKSHESGLRAQLDVVGGM